MGMFGKLGDMQKMMSQLKEMKAAADEAKKKLDEIVLEGKSKCKRVVIRITGNQHITKLEIDHNAFESTQELDEVLLDTFNRALDASKKRQEKEMADSAKGMLPGM
ncbi:YbaB/EbfC family nucleoid-associated protein [Luteibaculum oceani]|uniref:YbaB/EbfC family nucleoid-associated protein n=1 Tax=Luteibaculum oceani TaxID=1294296 RepID=A0A5C6VKN3_9FLAO|nr:YbaB/EbfC family nucleoid-associated protein [Luteibaculum oceani]TXC85254.1 YbaB/EbfC family nucleoid-associated protein [Luteibaculum oceani]